MAVVAPGVLLRTPLLQIGVPVAVGLAAAFALLGFWLPFTKIKGDPIRDPRRP